MVDPNRRRQVVIWLASGAILIFFMVLIGGITRLTGSGLSMTDWKLIAGSIPPTTEEAWQKSFEHYQQFPEFESQLPGFSLSDYKSIFWWEYIHRLLGRLIGIVFIIPFVFFLFKKAVKGVFVWKLLALFVMGGLQGFFGWYMVKSGLIDDPHVSHYRLALHLVTALVTFSYTFWLILEILFPKKLDLAYAKIKRMNVYFMILLFVQIIYGAFTAGLKAGLFYNTFPLMGDEWIAEGVTAMTPLYLNFIEGIGGVQFIHRYLGIALFIFGVFYFTGSRKMETSMLKESMRYVFFVVLIQVLLGIFTLIFNLPLSLALLHQIGAFFLLMSTIYSLRLSTHSV